MRHRWNAVLLAMVTASVYIAVGMRAAAEPEASDSKQLRPFKPVQPIAQMMEGQKKLYTEIKEGILDKTWKEAATSAWTLAEIANANHYQREDPAYQTLTDKLSAGAVALAKVLDKQDERAAKEMVVKIGRTCQTCHEKYHKD